MSRYWTRTIDSADHKEWSAGAVGEQRGVETTLTWTRDGWQIHGFVTAAILVDAWETVSLVERNETTPVSAVSRSASTKWQAGTDRDGQEWFVQASNVREEGPAAWVMKAYELTDEHLPCGGYYDGAGCKAKARADLKRHVEGDCSCYSARVEPVSADAPPALQHQNHPADTGVPVQPEVHR